MTNIDTSKMSRAVRRLWENAQVHDLSLRVLGQYLGVSHQAVKLWFEGAAPTPENEAMILAACAKIEAEYPEPVMQQLPSGGQVSAASWRADDPDDPAIAECAARRARLRVMFNMLQDKLTDPEKRILAVSWVGFSEVVHLAEKYDVAIPKK